MKIPESIKKFIDQQKYPLLFASISGSHLYGFPSSDSDYDLRGVHILPVEKVLGLHTGLETLEKSQVYEFLEIDLVTHDIKKFLLLLLKKNGYVLEQIYSPLIIATTPEHQELKLIAKGCITRHHSHHYFGFAETQWKLFEKEQPHRLKPLLYIYRVLLTGIYLMQTGLVEANLIKLNEIFNLPYIPELIAQKQLELEKSVLLDVNIDFHHKEYQKLRAKLQESYEVSQLPEIATAKDALHDLLLRVRLVGCVMP